MLGRSNKERIQCIKANLNEILELIADDQAYAEQLSGIEKSVSQLLLQANDDAKHKQLEIFNLSNEIEFLLQELGVEKVQQQQKSINQQLQYLQHYKKTLIELKKDRKLQSESLKHQILLLTQELGLEMSVDFNQNNELHTDTINHLNRQILELQSQIANYKLQIDQNMNKINSKLCNCKPFMSQHERDKLSNESLVSGSLLFRKTILDQIIKQLEELESLERQKYDFLKKELEELSKALMIPLPSDLANTSSELALTLESLKLKWNEKMNSEINQLWVEIHKYWDACHVSMNEQIEFKNYTCRILILIQELSIVNAHKELLAHKLDLEQRYQHTKHILKLIEKRSELIVKINNFEITASDPRRLFRPSFQLLEEEKFRKSCFPNLLKMEYNLRNLISEYESQFGIFKLDGKHFLSEMNLEIENRFINDSIFVLSKTPKKHTK